MTVLALVPGVLAVLFAVGFGLGVWALRTHARKQLALERQCWVDFARMSALTLDQAPLRLSGTWEGVKLEVFQEEVVDGHGHVSRVTRVSVCVDSALPWNLELTRRRPRLAFLEHAGGQEAPVGEPTFDATFQLENATAEALVVLRAPEVQRILLEQARLHGKEFALRNGELELVAHHSCGEPGALERLLRPLIACVHAMEAARKADPTPAPRQPDAR